MCFWLLHPPLSLLISSTAEEVLLETAAQALSTDLACVSGLFPPCRLCSLGLKSRGPEVGNQKIPIPIPPQGSSPCGQWGHEVLTRVPTDSGKVPCQVFKDGVNNLVVNSKALFERGHNIAQGLRFMQL
ncbi:hypothetical protein CHARACLAT_002831 [Characodon lateralis]|uniref:Uncharacterized protein n=1 Tax=Characodon lateralis TaxID=208331 RepID=A0ABU7CWI7_9TELE|nr:hypothetical protein [Characodon lateralis]